MRKSRTNWRTVLHAFDKPYRKISRGRQESSVHPTHKFGCRRWRSVAEASSHEAPRKSDVSTTTVDAIRNQPYEAGARNIEHSTSQHLPIYTPKMAPATSADNVYQLSPDQQDLLLVALTSNTNSSPMFNTPGLAQHRQAQTIPKSLDHTADYQIPTSNDTPMPHSAGLSSSYADGTPYLGDNLEFGAWDADGDGTWDYDFVGEAMQHDTPDSNNTTDGGTTNGDTPQPQIKTEHEKRKEHPEGDKSLDPHDAEPKRRGALSPSVRRFATQCFIISTCCPVL